MNWTILHQISQKHKKSWEFLTHFHCNEWSLFIAMNFHCTDFFHCNEFIVCWQVYWGWCLKFETEKLTTCDLNEREEGQIPIYFEYDYNALVASIKINCQWLNDGSKFFFLQYIFIHSTCFYKYTNSKSISFEKTCIQYQIQSLQKIVGQFNNLLFGREL